MSIEAIGPGRRDQLAWPASVVGPSYRKVYMEKTIADLNPKGRWKINQSDKLVCDLSIDVVDNGTFYGKATQSGNTENIEGFVHEAFLTSDVKWSDSVTGVYCGTLDPLKMLAGWTWQYGNHANNACSWLSNKSFQKE
jgi:hypothetical protein